MNKALLAHSGKVDWETPHVLFKMLDIEFQFDLDVCAESHNAKLPSYFSPKEDGLRQSWAGRRCWLNPPYGKHITAWVQRAASSDAALVVGLLPARTDTRWWHDSVMSAASEIRLIRGRLLFEGAKSGAPFPSVIVVWRPGPRDSVRISTMYAPRPRR